jgi:tetratricopeptide (TPR) repeat protein
MPGITKETGLLMADSFFHLGEKSWPSAMSHYNQVLTQDPKCTNALHGSSVILIELSKYHEAARYLDKVMEIASDHTAAKIDRAWVTWRLDQVDQGLQELLELEREMAPHYLVKYRLAYIDWHQQGKHLTDTSLVHGRLIESARLNPSFADKFALLGVYYKEMEQDMTRAIKCFTKAMSLQSTNVVAAKHLSALLIQQGRQDQAYSLLDMFVESRPRAGWAWKQLGILSLDARRGHSAISQFQCSL